MKPSPARSALTVAVCVLALAAAVPAQQGDEPQMTPEEIAEMNAWMALAEPGEHHEHLGWLAGRWKGDIQMWMAPGSEPMRDVGEAEARWALGGRFLAWRHTGSFQGSPFEGLSFDGYNNGDERYETIWMDNFGTLILYYTGSCSDDGRVRTLNTSFRDVVGGGEILYRALYTVEDEDHFTYESFMRKDGEEEFRNLFIRWTRQ
ncbi:MAG: DUF1579 domain-containing protein [Thermoanaerobaculia bacterium]|nr:DUF1579 domain-containing protein [Thermoanaerobaculia bacterium]